MSFLGSLNYNYFWRELLPSCSCWFLGWLWRWTSDWHGLFWIFLKTKPSCSKSLKPCKWKPEHRNASENDFDWCWKSLWESTLYVWEVSQEGKSSPPWRTTVLCIGRITLNLFGAFLGLICLSRAVRAADSEFLTLPTLAKMRPIWFSIVGNGERKLLRKSKIFTGFKVLFLCKGQLKESRIKQCSNFLAFQKQN